MKDLPGPVFICTDMEGIAGVNHWDQCYHPDDNAPIYLDGLRNLAADLHATVEGCLRAGVTDIRVLDGHGRNHHCGLYRGGLHPRAQLMVPDSAQPTRLKGLDSSVHAVLMVGQHAMAGTLHGFLDHTQDPKRLCRFLINGEDHGELTQFAVYAGAYGIPLVHVSGDEALCVEARRLFPGVGVTATKRGLGWETCDLYPPGRVRAQIADDVALALKSTTEVVPMAMVMPVEIGVEFAWSGLADELAIVPGVKRMSARAVSWMIYDPLDIYAWPSARWSPAAATGA